MHILKYRCDICKKEGPWVPGWLSVTILISRRLFWEHEFHVCSKECDGKLDQMNRTQLKALIFEKDPHTFV